MSIMNSSLKPTARVALAMSLLAVAAPVAVAGCYWCDNGSAYPCSYNDGIHTVYGSCTAVGSGCMLSGLPTC